MPEFLTTAFAGVRMGFAGLVWFVQGPSKRRAHRLAIKRDVEANLRVPKDGAIDAIVRNEWRMDAYPRDISLKWFGGPSSWHKAEVIGTYEAGIETCVDFPTVVIDWDKEVARKDPDGEKVCAVARIPFDLIGEIDWTGDDYYPQPHIYCRYRFRRGPYEKTLSIRRKESWSGDSYVRVEGVRYRPRRPRIWSTLKARHRYKKAIREQEQRLR
jgi:hypothetical protein